MLLLTGAIWGGGFVVMKNALDTIPVNWLLVFRFAIGALGLSFSLFRNRQKLTKALVGHSAIVGFLMYAAFASQTYGLGMTTAGKNALITAIYVVLVPLFGWYVNKKRPPLRTLAAAFIMLIGIALLSWTGDGAVNLGDLLTLLCGVLYALEIMAVDRYGAGVDMFQFSCLQYSFVALYALLPALLFESFPRSWNGEMVFALGYCGIAATLVAMTLMNIGIRYASPNYASLLMSTESAFGCLFGVIFLHELLSARMTAGGVLILGALLISQLKPKEKRVA
ncbi:MAG: DMT family transporter [Eubacteriales bacterium]|nr:DMT family transporter [Eubacteriales bacterium]